MSLPLSTNIVFFLVYFILETPCSALCPYSLALLAYQCATTYQLPSVHAPHSHRKRKLPGFSKRYEFWRARMFSLSPWSCWSTTDRWLVQGLSVTRQVRWEGGIWGRVSASPFSIASEIANQVTNEDISRCVRFWLVNMKLWYHQITVCENPKQWPSINPIRSPSFLPFKCSRLYLSSFCILPFIDFLFYPWMPCLQHSVNHSFSQI